ncbi:MAG: aspartate kinase [Candidatus Peribacteraceae bacterium]|nr:aspartate kinase [Candidatus Peribacteraceae bacterium]
MIVMKFGGTSVGSAKAISEVAAIVKLYQKRKPVVVVSAVSGVTDTLIRLAQAAAEGGGTDILQSIHGRHKDILTDLKLSPKLCAKQFAELEALVKTVRQRKNKLTKKTLDVFQSFGEPMSSVIVAAAITKHGVPSKGFPAWELGMITDGVFGDAEPLKSSFPLLKKRISALNVVPVVTGFIGKTEKGDIVTLGRGGSDYTAAILGAALKAEAIQIWKEVDGFLTTDPRIVPEAKVVHELAFEEACELAYFGAKVLHPKTILPAMDAGVPVQVLNTFKPEGKGTTIVSSFEERHGKSHTVEAFSRKKGITVIHIRSPEFFDGSGLMANVFKIFEKHRTSVDLIATSVVSVSLTIDDCEHLDGIVQDLSSLGEVKVVSGKAIICMVGGSINAAGVAGRIFTVLGAHEIPVEMISQAAGGVSMTFVVDEGDTERALHVLHDTFIGTIGT